MVNRPERSAGRPRFAYFPFRGGPRQCIGNAFAMMEAQLVLATVAQHYSLRLVPNHPVEPLVMLTMRPRFGLPMTLHPRLREDGEGLVDCRRSHHLALVHSTLVLRRR